MSDIKGIRINPVIREKIKFALPLLALNVISFSQVKNIIQYSYEIIEHFTANNSIYDTCMFCLK